MGLRFRDWAAKQRRRLRLVELAMRHPKTPWYAKAVGGATLVYALSPIDLIPDFLPVIGFADDALLVALVLRHVVRRSGAELVTEHWPGTDAGLTTVLTLVGA